MRHRISGLDGLRALAIGLVLSGHTFEKSPPASPSYWLTCLTNHRLGVSVFFVLSGLLITWLLLEEKRATGKIQLGLFYLRRVCRIFPAFYTFLFTVGTLALAGVLEVPLREWVGAAFFFWNYLPQAACWWVAHFWSLAVEEQFYLLWPCLLFFLGKPRASRLAVGIILVSPLIRVATYAAFPEWRDRLFWMGHTQMDLIMFGCWAALVAKSVNGVPHWNRVPAHVAWTGLAFTLFLSPALCIQWRSAYSLTIQNTVEGIALALFLIWVVQNPRSLAGKFFNQAPVAYIGRLSFSLYLWQQLFLSYLDPFGLSLWQSLIAAFAAAVVSYHGIEKPFLRLGARFQSVTPSARPLKTLFSLKA
ncbi:acyltransferase [bacterium]|nr:acyltransferase [bacterium]